MAEIKVEKVTLDKLDVLQNLVSILFVKPLVLIIPRRNFNNFSMTITL